MVLNNYYVEIDAIIRDNDYIRKSLTLKEFLYNSIDISDIMDNTIMKFNCLNAQNSLSNEIQNYFVVIKKGTSIHSQTFLQSWFQYQNNEEEGVGWINWDKLIQKKNIIKANCL